MIIKWVPEYPSVKRWFNKVKGIFVVEYYTSIRNDELGLYLIIWKGVQDMVFSFKAGFKKMFIIISYVCKNSTHITHTPRVQHSHLVRIHLNMSCMHEEGGEGAQCTPGGWQHIPRGSRRGRREGDLFIFFICLWTNSLITKNML